MRLVTVSEVLAGELPPVEWMVEPLLARGERCIMYGTWGTLKSWIMLHMALHLAAGKDWLGFHIDRPYKVLYIDEEMRLRGAWRRMWRLARGMGIPQEPALPFLLTSDARFRARNAESANGLLAEVKRRTNGFEPELTVIETLRATLRGPEGNSDNVEEYYDYLYPFMDKGRSLIITHHMRKPPVGADREGVKHEARGSGRIMDFPDAGFAVTRPSEYVEAVMFEHAKTRETQRVKPFGIKLMDHCTAESGCGPKGHNCVATLVEATEEVKRLLGGEY